MARRKISYQKNHQNRFSMFLVTIVVVMILVVASIKSIEMKEKLTIYNAKIEQLEGEYEAEQSRTTEIEEYQKYTKTKKYVEDVAKDKLGLVYEGEILFQEE